MPDEAYLALLDALARRLRVDPAGLRQAQTLSIGGRRIDFSVARDADDAAEDRIVVRCGVTRLPAPAREDVCRLLLQANNLWAGTAGASLGLLGERDVIASEAVRLASVDADRLAALVTGLCAQAQAWEAELERRWPAAEAAPPRAGTTPAAVPLHLRA
ncbi:MAG: type III secretion system chaperone [Bordetella sp.]|nr:type III secretion system chaperone [Bordetella sp.]